MNSNVVRAWKDEFYRRSLSDEERSQLPENPVGELELTDTELGSVFAAQGTMASHDEDRSCQTFKGDCYHSRYYYACHHYPTQDYNDCKSHYWAYCGHHSYEHHYECETFKKEH